MDQTNEAAIRARAYEIWERSDRTPGKHDEHWRQAERELHEAGRKTGTDTGSQHSDGISELPAQDDEAPPLHRVPEPGPGR